MRAPHFFCGGPPKSGTTFIQRILDLHPEIGCSSEDNLQFLAKNFFQLHQSYNNNLSVFGERIGAKNIPLVERKVFENALFNLISDISLNRNHGKKIGISDNTFLLNNLIPILKFYINKLKEWVLIIHYLPSVDDINMWIIKFVFLIFL